MAQVKITDLTAYADPVSTDVLPVVDVTANTTKKVSIATLLKNASLGTAALPGIAFDGDPNTGLYSPGADQVSISTAGTGRLFVGSDGKVGIGTTSPGARLDILGTTPSLHISDNTGGTPDYRGYTLDFSTRQPTGGINFLISSPSAFLDLYAGGSAANLGGWDGQIRFFTGGTNSYGTERLRITSDGKVGIGTTSPGAVLDVQSSLGFIANLSSSNAAGGYITIGKTGSTSLLGSFNAGSGGGSSINADALYFRSAYGIGFNSTGGGGVVNACLDTSGRFLVGTSTAFSAGASAQYGKFQIVGNTFSASTQGIISIGRGQAAGASITSGAAIGTLVFSDNTGGEFAQIACEADAATGTNDYPGRLVFSTTADGASSPTERMRIANNGVVTVKNGAVAEIGTLTDAATITPDFAANCNFTVTLGGNRTIANPTSVTAGQSGSIFIVQDATGGRTASWGANWDWSSGAAPTLSTAANAVDRIDYVVRSATSIHAVWTGSYS